MVATTREIVFLLKTEMDASVSADYQEMAKQARDAQSTILETGKRTFQEEEKLRKERISNFEAELREIATARKEQAKEEERDRKEALRAGEAAKRERQKMAREEEQERKEALRAQKAAERERQKMAREEERDRKEALRAQKAAERERQKMAEEANKVVEDAQKKSVHATEDLNKRLHSLVQGRRGLVSSTMQLVRGMTLLMGSNSKELEKVLRNLMLVQGAYDALRGSLGIINALSGAWKAYRAAVLAAAAAHATLTTAQLASAAAGTTSAAKGAARGVGAVVGGFGAGAAVGGGGNLLSRFLTTRAAAGLAAFGGPALKAAGIGIGIGAGAYSVYDVSRQAYRYGLGGGAAPGSWTDWLGGAAWNPAGWVVAPDRRWGYYSGRRAQRRREEETLAGEQARAEAREQDLEAGRAEISRRALRFRYRPLSARRAEEESARTSGGVKTARSELREAQQANTATIGSLRKLGQAEAAVNTAVEAHLQSLNEELRARNTQVQKEKESWDKQIAAARKHYEELERQYEQHAEREKQLRQRAFESTAAISLMDPAARRKLIRAIEATTAGTGTRGQAAAALDYLGPEERKTTQTRFIEKLSPREREIIAGASAASIAAERRRKEDAQRAVKAAEEDVKNLEAKAEAALKKSTDTIKAVVKQLEKYENELNVLNGEIRKIAREQALREKAIAG